VTHPESAAVAAAQWWAKQIGAPVHKIMTDDATGRDRDLGDFAAMSMAIISGRHPVRDGQGEQFVAALAPVIADRLSRLNRVVLGVDYGPDRELAEAASTAGIHYSRFPFKTHMSITADYVTAALGYGAPSALIWQSPDWVRPQCGTHDYDGDYYALDPMCTKPKFHDGGHGDWAPDPQRCETCGGTYVYHYGRESREVLCSYKPVTPVDNEVSR
jgi:hypothetical protein